MHHLLVLLFLAGIQTANSATNETGPDAIWAKGNRFPFFVAAKASLDEHGVPNPSLLDEASREYLRMEIERRGRGAKPGTRLQGNAEESEACDVAIVSPHAWWSARSRPWEEIVAKSRATIRGTVVATTAGFQLLAPVTLLTIRIDETVQPSVPFPTSGVIHVIYPTADFRVGGARFCRVHESGFMPRAGDEVILLAAESPSDENASFVTPLEVVFVRGDRLIVPENVSDRDRLLARESPGALFRSLSRQ